MPLSFHIVIYFNWQPYLLINNYSYKKNGTESLLVVILIDMFS